MLWALPNGSRVQNLEARVRRTVAIEHEVSSSESKRTHTRTHARTYPLILPTTTTTHPSPSPSPPPPHNSLLGFDRMGIWGHHNTDNSPVITINSVHSIGGYSSNPAVVANPNTVDNRDEGSGRQRQAVIY